MRRTGLLCLVLSPLIGAAPAVTAPPESVFAKFRDRDRDVARRFYKKCLEIDGVPVLASADVADEALQRTHEIVTHLLAGRPDILEALAKYGTRLIIIGKDQVYTDMPEYRDSPNPEYQNERVRGTGGLRVTSFGEENLLNLAGDRYDDESIGVHEFCHTIDAALGRIDPTWRDRLVKTYRNSVAAGLWMDAYAGSNPGEYWAENCQSYFDCNRVNNWNHNSVGTREQLKPYDPEGYDLSERPSGCRSKNDWRPAGSAGSRASSRRRPGLAIDPYSSKFTYAGVPGARVEEGQRRGVAQGHQHGSEDVSPTDMTSRLGPDSRTAARLDVLGRDEALGDLPEFQGSKKTEGFDQVRYLDYHSVAQAHGSSPRRMCSGPTTDRLGCAWW